MANGVFNVDSFTKEFKKFAGATQTLKRKEWEKLFQGIYDPFEYDRHVSPRIENRRTKPQK